jgi:hypothetical protein
LRAIIHPKSPISLGDECFETSGIESIVVPVTVKEIGDSAFKNSLKLTSISVLDDCKVGNEAFSGCLGLVLIASKSNRKIEDYFRATHLKKQKVDLRVAVLLG